MRRQAERFYLVLALYSLCGSAPWAQDAQPCQLRRVSALDIKYNPQGLPTVPATVAGQSLSMLVSTGSPNSFLPDKTTVESYLPVMPLPGSDSLRYVTTKDFALGRLSLPNFILMVSPGKADNSGTLGADLLSNFNADFDFGANKLNLILPNECGDRNVYWASDYAKVPLETDEEQRHQIYAEATLDGVQVKVRVVTGANVSVLTLTHAKALFHWSDDQPGLEKFAGGPSSAVSLYHYPFKQLTFGGVNVANPQIDVLSENNIYAHPTERSQEEDEMIVGMELLRKLHILISYKDKVMYVTPANEPTDTAAAH